MTARVCLLLCFLLQSVEDEGVCFRNCRRLSKKFRVVGSSLGNSIQWARLRKTFRMTRKTFDFISHWSVARAFPPVPQPRPQGFSLKKMGGAGKGPGIGWSRAQPKYSWEANLYATRGFCADRSRTEQQWKIIISRTVCQYFCVCAIQKLKIHLIAYYSNATSLWKGVPALRCQVQNMSNASALRQAVMSHCYRQVLLMDAITVMRMLAICLFRINLSGQH